MVLLVFRLNKDTTTSATFVIPKTLVFDKMIFKGFSSERHDDTVVDGGGISFDTASELSIYLECGLFGDNEVCFFQGTNTTINNDAGSDTGVGNLLPLGGFKKDVAVPYKQMDLTVIDQPTRLDAGFPLTLGLLQIQLGVVQPLTSAQAFGTLTNDGTPAGPIDHGFNLYFELETMTAHDHDQTINIADSS